MTTTIEKIRREGISGDVTPFRAGDSVSVHTRVYEGDKERVQVFSGTVIARDGTGATETFTVRRISHGVGVEKVFPVHSPHIARMEVDSSASVRRAKLYYLRRKSGKQARLREKIRK